MVFVTLAFCIFSPVRGIRPIPNNFSAEIIDDYIQIRASKGNITKQGAGSFSVLFSTLGGSNSAGEFAFGRPTLGLGIPPLSVMWVRVRRPSPVEVRLTNLAVPVEILPVVVATKSRVPEFR